MPSLLNEKQLRPFIMYTISRHKTGFGFGRERVCPVREWGVFVCVSVVWRVAREITSTTDCTTAPSKEGQNPPSFYFLFLKCKINGACSNSSWPRCLQSIWPKNAHNFIQKKNSHSLTNTGGHTTATAIWFPGQPTRMHRHTNRPHPLCTHALSQHQICKPVLCPEMVYIWEGRSCWIMKGEL